VVLFSGILLPRFKKQRLFIRDNKSENEFVRNNIAYFHNLFSKFLSVSLVFWLSLFSDKIWTKYLKLMKENSLNITGCWAAKAESEKRYTLPHRDTAQSRVAIEQWTHVTECKIWGFHSCDYEECRLLGYKITVPTSQEAHCVSATEPSRLILSDLKFSLQ
jgi:hypothetical protein